MATDPSTTDSSQCIVCGRSVSDHSNPNTDYRGNTGTAPPTDHYFEGGNLNGSDDKPYFTNKRGGFAGYDSSDSPNDVYINAGKTGKIWGKKFESKASEDISFADGVKYRYSVVKNDEDYHETDDLEEAKNEAYLIGGVVLDSKNEWTNVYTAPTYTESKASKDRDWDGRSDLEKLERDQELSQQFWNKSSTLNEIPDSYYKESKANEDSHECPHCDGKGSYRFRSYPPETCSWCRGTGKLDEDQMDEFQQNEDKWNNIARMDNDINLTTDSDIEKWGESKASEIGMHGNDGASFYDGKTFTCSHCGKVGNSFSDMAQEECPNNDRGGHQIPIFGDQLKSKRPTRADVEASEVNIERGDNSMKIDGKNVIKIWETMNGWYHYAVEDHGKYTGVGADGNDVEAHEWFGYTQGDYNEWGYFDSKEFDRNPMVWEVPKSNWGWTGKESKASEADHSNCPRGSVFPMDDDDGVFGSVCTNCGQNFDRDGEPCEDCVVARDNESKASEDYEEDKKIIDKLLKKNGSVSFDDFLAQHGDYPQSLDESKASEVISDSDKQILSDWVSQNRDWTTIDDLPNEIFIPLMASFGDDIDKRVEAQVEIIDYMESLGEVNIGAESWNQKSSINKIEALERVGLKQGDAIKLSGLEFDDFGEDLQDALKGDVEDYRKRYTRFTTKTEDMKKYGEPSKITGEPWQVGGEVDNPNSEFDQNYPDYNNIGKSQTNMTNYECEFCDNGFESNESLSIHYNDKHAISPESLDGYERDDGDHDAIEDGKADWDNYGRYESKVNESDIMEWITLWDNPEPTTDKLRNFLRSKGYPDNEITDVIEQHNLIEHFGESKASEFNIHGYDWDEKCPNCGSDDIEDTVGQGGASGYHCMSCDEYFDNMDLMEKISNESKASEDDPDFDNDPDFEGKIDGVSVEPSQYTQSGMDHTDYGRGDIDESKASENSASLKHRIQIENGHYTLRMFDQYGNMKKQMYYRDEQEARDMENSFWERGNNGSSFNVTLEKDDVDISSGNESKSSENHYVYGDKSLIANKSTDEYFTFGDGFSTCKVCGEQIEGGHGHYKHLQTHYSEESKASEDWEEDLDGYKAIGKAYKEKQKMDKLDDGEAEASEVCPECNSSKVHINRDKGDSRFGQGKYACNNCGNTFGGEAKINKSGED